MKFFWAQFTLLSLLLALSVSVDAQTFYGTTDVKKFLEGRDKEFRNKEESPLTEKDFLNFKGLNYFSVNAKYRVSAEFVRTSDAKYFQMPTSSGRSQKYIKFGVLKFKLNGKDYSLNVYQSDAETLAKFPEYKDLLFVPFKDATNGKSTYGGGRYINLKAPLGKQVILDFNLAYNPSCAYGSDRYSCPLPPKENFLTVEINAGEKSYQYSNAK